jgi:AraC-like DNA-binding protein
MIMINCSNIANTARRQPCAILSSEFDGNRRPNVNVGVANSSVAHSAFDGLSNGQRSCSLPHPVVDITPGEFVSRQVLTRRPLTTEIIRSNGCERVDFRFLAPVHLLILYEQGARHDGETVVRGAPKSVLRDFAGKLTFVPSGHEYRECQDLRTPARLTYFYLNPSNMPINVESNTGCMVFEPKLYFEDATLLNTALKLTRSVECLAERDRPYTEALSSVLMHEVLSLREGGTRVNRPVRSGLAAWQERTVASYIGAHLDEQISLTTLAQLARLSPYHFCRMFKRSFGVSPHRYHMERRMEFAKSLLAERSHSVTDIALTVGYSECGSFTAAFRKVTGFTPSAYQRAFS